MMCIVLKIKISRMWFIMFLTCLLINNTSAFFSMVKFLPFKTHPCERSMKPDPLWHAHSEPQHGGLTHRHMSKPLKHQSFNLPFLRIQFYFCTRLTSSPPPLLILYTYPLPQCEPTPLSVSLPNTLLQRLQGVGHSRITTCLKNTLKMPWREKRERKSKEKQDLFIRIMFNSYK